MITSVANEKARFLRSLHQAKGRRGCGCFLVEGVRLVEEALRAGVRPRIAFVAPAQLERTERGCELLAGLSSDEWLPVTEKVLQSVATTVTPQGIVAAVPMVKPREPLDLGPLPVALDRLADPGNVGTILRSAEAAGVTTVFLLQGTVDPYSPKVVRAAAGAHFHLNLLMDQIWESVRKRLAGWPILATVAEGGTSIYAVNWRQPTALIIGSEAHGVSAESLAVANGRVSIPMVGPAESLNAAVAASVVMFEALRQRLYAGQDKGG